MDDLLTVKLQGECSRCPVANGCFSDWFLSEIHKKFGDNIKIKKIIEKPYFWDFRVRFFNRKLKKNEEVILWHMLK